MPTRKTDERTYPTITRAEAEAWRDLHRQLARTRTLQDAKDIAAQATPPHAKRFYTLWSAKTLYEAKLPAFLSGRVLELPVGVSTEPLRELVTTVQLFLETPLG